MPRSASVRLMSYLSCLKRGSEFLHELKPLQRFWISRVQAAPWVSFESVNANRFSCSSFCFHSGSFSACVRRQMKSWVELDPVLRPWVTCLELSYRFRCKTVCSSNLVSPLGVPLWRHSLTSASPSCFQGEVTSSLALRSSFLSCEQEGSDFRNSYLHWKFLALVDSFGSHAAARSY